MFDINISSNNPLIHIISKSVIPMLRYSVSAENLETAFCFLTSHEINELS